MHIFLTRESFAWIEGTVMDDALHKTCGLVELTQEDLKRISGGNALDTVTGSFARQVGEACYTFPIEFNQTPVKLCVVLYA